MAGRSRPTPSGDHAPLATAPLACVLALVTIFIVYGSLYPFVFHQPAGTTGPFRALLDTWREWDRRGDLASNILLYMPFGFFVTRTMPGRVPTVVGVLVAMLAGIALSISMELAQFYDEGRVTSMGDVYANTIGSAVGAITSALLGASMQWPFIRELGANPPASMLLATFLGYRLYPYVPMIDRHKYWRAVEGLLQQPIPPPGDLARFVVTWLFVAVVIESLYGFRRWFLLFPMVVFGVFAARILIVDLSLTSADVLGAGIAFILWTGPLRWLPGRPVVLAGLFAGLIAAMRLEPFTFSPVPLRGFGWVPFWSLMNGSINVAMQAFFEKFYQYGGLIWLLCRSGIPLVVATGLTAALLFITSYAEVYLPGRSGEMTDAAMAVVIGVAFHSLRNAALARPVPAPITVSAPGQNDMIPPMTGPPTRRPRPEHYLSADGHVVSTKQRSVTRRLLRLLVILACLSAVAGGAVAGVVLCQVEWTPREWAPYLQRHVLRYPPLIADGVDLVARWLIRADRLRPSEPFKLPSSLGASVDRSDIAREGRLRLVASLQALSEAAATAKPGDVIELAPGRYRFGGYSIKFSQPGTETAPITVRAARLDNTVIESDGVETFHVSAPFWRFENLSMRGVCGDHSDCEHAIHVVGGATDVRIRNNRFEDYNAHIKVNGEGGHFPDRGVIEGNTFTETAPRMTGNPVTSIDLVAANDWHIRGNIIADFVRAADGQASYGALVKGAGEGNVIERNLVICEWKLGGVTGQHVGLSLGGGGTDDHARRDQGRSAFEQVGGIIRDNLIVSCNDDGIYLNRAARSVVDHNTLLDTAGIDARFVETSATVTANIVDGTVRVRDGASLRGTDNAVPFLLSLFAGWHPQRGYFRNPAALDLTWRTAPDRLPESDPGIDLCGRQRGGSSAPGAFGDFSACLAGQ